MGTAERATVDCRSLDRPEVMDAIRPISQEPPEKCYVLALGEAAWSRNSGLAADSCPFDTEYPGAEKLQTSEVDMCPIVAEVAGCVAIGSCTDR